MALSKGFRIFEKKQPNHSIILEHRQRTQEALLFESQAVALLCKNTSHTNQRIDVYCDWISMLIDVSSSVSRFMFSYHFN